MLTVNKGDTGTTPSEAIMAYLSDPASTGVILPGDVLLQKGDEFIVVSRCVDPQHYQEWEVVEVFASMIEREQ